jgi:N-acyl-L-homoserine lactone synthetase
LRGEAVLACGWLRPDDLKDGLEWDSYDADALHLVGVADGRVVATTRLVFPRPDRLLPTEELFGLRIEPLGAVVEGGRLVIVPEHRDPRLLAGLFAMQWLEMRARGYRHYCGNATPERLSRYASLGFRTVVLGAPALVWGEQRVPVRLDLVATAAETGYLAGRALGQSTKICV